MPTTVQIPADGSSVPAKDFKAAGKVVAEAFEGSDTERKQVAAAIAAATAVIDAGHAGDENVYAVIGVSAGTPLNSSERIVSIGVHARPAPLVAVLPSAAPTGPAPRGPFETGATADEIKREAANRLALGLPNANVEDVAAELGAPVPGASPYDVPATQPSAKTAPTKTSTAKPAQSKPAAKSSAAVPAGKLTVKQLREQKAAEAAAAQTVKTSAETTA